MPTATIVTSMGSFTVKLLPDHAPKTVANFVDLATGGREWTDPRDGERKSEALYPGTIFHRVIDGVGEVEIGWSVTPRRARQGIATEAAAAWRDRCLGPLGMDHVISLIRPENVPSRGVAERIGMTVWKETLHGAERWLHLVYRVDAAPAPPPR